MALNGIPINEYDCIGDSLDTINNAFISLDNSIAGINLNFAEVKSKVEQIIVDQNYLGVWVKQPIGTGDLVYDGMFLSYDYAKDEWFHNPNIISKVNTSTVGIGISTPLAKLHVNSTASNTPALIVDSTDSLANMEIRGATGGSIDFKKTGSPLDYIVRLQSEGSGDVNGGGALKVLGNYFDIATGTSTSTLSTLLRIANGNGGRVGIRTTSPRSELDVKGKGTFTGGLSVEDSSTFTNNITLNNSGGYAWTRLVAQSGAYIEMKTPYNTTEDFDLRLITWNQAQTSELFSTQTFRFRLSSNPIEDRSHTFTTDGKFGIGTYNPTEKLHVQGNALINGCLTLSGGNPLDVGANYVDSPNLSGTYLHLRHAGSSNDWALIRQIGGINAYHLAIDLHDDALAELGGQTFSVRNVGSTANPDEIIPLIHATTNINNAARVGINTSSPQATLDVNGAVCVGRQSATTTEEGGEIQLARALDNTPSLFIDSLGSTTNPRLRVYSRPLGTAGSELFTALSAVEGPRVGIGVADPKVALHVKGTTFSNILSADTIYANNVVYDAPGINDLNLDTLTVQNAATFNSSTINGKFINLTNSGGWAGIEARGSSGSHIDLTGPHNDSADFDLRLIHDTTDNTVPSRLQSTHNFGILTGPSTTSQVHRFVVTTAGNVGISTSSPSEALHVVGNIYATNTVYTSGSTGGIAVDQGGTGGFFEQRSVTGSGNAAYMTFHRPNIHAVRFGLDTDNQLKVGGWSLGNNAYRILHEGIDEPALKDSLYINSSTSARLELLGTSGAYIDLRRNPFEDYALRLSHFTSENAIDSKGAFRIYTGPRPSGSPLVYGNPVGLTILEGIVGTRGGYVGINTATPAYQLDVNGGARVYGLTVGRQDSSLEGGEIQLARASDNTPSISLDVFGSGTDPKFRIFKTDGSGDILTANKTSAEGVKVGINNSTPIETLDVIGSLGITSPGDNSNFLRFSGNRITSFYNVESVAELQINTYSHNTPALRQFRNTNIYDGKGNHIITAVGETKRVGINKSNPLATCHVGGDLTVDGNLVVNGKNLNQLPDGVPIGTVTWLATDSVPLGYLKCDGTAYSKTEYPALYAKIGNTFATTGGLAAPASTMFRVPDLRSEFIRGWDNGRGVDTGRQLGSNQLDSFEDHQHDLKGNNGGQYYATNDTNTVPTDNGAFRSQGPSTDNDGQYNPYTGKVLLSGTFVDTAVTRVGAETRPRNVALMPCIKAYNPEEAIELQSTLNLTQYATQSWVQGYLDDADNAYAKVSDFTGTNQSVSANGFQKLPGGLIIQWGTIIPTQTAQTVKGTFPIPFPNQTLNVVLVREIGANIKGDYYSANVYNISRSDFYAQCPYLENGTWDNYLIKFRYIAIGY